MATSFTKTDSWQPVRVDPDYVDGGAQPAGVTSKASSGKTYMRLEYNVTQERVVQGLISFLPEIGTTKTGDNLSMVNGADTLVANSAYTYECLEDTLQPNPPGSGIWLQVQIWQWRDAWAEVDIATGTTP